MTGLIIFLCIILFFVILFISSITLYVNYSEDLSIKLGFWGIKFLDLLKDDDEEEKPKKEKKPKIKRKKKTKSKKKSELTPAHTEEKNKSSDSTNKTDTPSKSDDRKKSDGKSKFSDTVTLALEIAKETFPKIKNILLNIRITALNLDMRVGSEDAHSTALNYSYCSMAVYQAIALLKTQIVVKIKRINITPDFTVSEVKTNVSFKLKIRLYVIIFSFVGIIIDILKNKEIMKRWRK